MVRILTLVVQHRVVPLTTMLSFPPPRVVWHRFHPTEAGTPKYVLLAPPETLGCAGDIRKISPHGAKTLGIGKALAIRAGRV